MLRSVPFELQHRQPFIEPTKDRAVGGLFDTQPILKFQTIATSTDTPIKSWREHMAAIPDGSSEFFKAGLATIYAQDKVTAGRLIIQGAIKPRLAKSTALHEKVDVMIESMVGAATTAKNSLVLARTVDQTTRELIDNDPLVGFQLIDSLAGQSEQEIDIADMQPEQSMSLLLTLYAESNGDSVYRKLQLELGEGGYDSTIAQGMLKAAMAVKDIEKNEAVIRDLQSMVLLVASAANISSEQAIVGLTTPTAFQHWHETSKQVVTNYRQACVEALRITYSKCTKVLGEHALLIDPTTEYYLKRHSDRLVKVLNRQATTITRNRPVRAATIVSDVSLESKGNKRVKTAQNTPAPIPAKVEKQTSPFENKLFYIDTQGNRVPQDHESFMGSITHNVKKLLEGDQAFNKDLKTMLDFLKYLSLSDGFVSGVKKLGQPMKLSGSTKTARYELKPNEVQNLSLTSGNSRNIRILFARPQPGIILIENIVKRNALGRWT